MKSKALTTPNVVSNHQHRRTHLANHASLKIETTETTGRTLAGSTFGIGTVTNANTQPNPFGILGTVTRAGSESIALASAADESTTATITGTITTGDVLSVVVQNSSLSGGQKTIQYTVVGGNTTTTIATAIKNAINADTALQAVGVQAISSANVLTLNPYTYYTGSSSGTETVAISNANRGSAAVTVGGTVTTGNTVTLTPHNPALSGGLRNITYTVIAGDTLTSIAKALADLVNADSILKAIGIKVSNAAALAWSQSFSGNALLPTGSSLASASAVDGSGNTKTNGYAMLVNSASSSTLTYDLNGNMTSDGTNSYSWDAEDRMTKIIYPGTNNLSTFVYDGLSRNVSIVETTAGSVTSTRQFVWEGGQRNEERDAAGVLTKKFYYRGQINSTTKYFYSSDQLGSTREMADNSGSVQAQYAFDPFGQLQKINEAVPSDFGFAGYYLHSRSGLDLTVTRAYNPGSARFLSRDKMEESGGTNLFAYVSNMPTELTDPLGLVRNDPSRINCLGYFCNAGGGRYPTPHVDTLLNIVGQSGWSCHPVKSAKDCCCPPGQRRGMGYLSTGYFGYGGSGWSAPFVAGGGNDYHFMQEQASAMPPGIMGPGTGTWTGVFPDQPNSPNPSTVSTNDPDGWANNNGYGNPERMCCCHK
ncbi:hypothetical protein BH10CYA1_BH10CYA1_61920 [soil metagenome]